MKQGWIKREEASYHYVDNKLHNDNGPAVIWNNAFCTKEWYKNNLLHRDDGPAIEYSDGQEWWNEGKRHRIDGPAVLECDGSYEWHRFGKRHRDDGPASYDYATGLTYWCYDNKYINVQTNEEFLAWKKFKAFI